MNRTHWALVWILSAVVFVAGVAWPLAAESEAAYGLSVVLCLPFLVLVAARTPRWLSELPDWLKLAAAVAPLLPAATFFVLSDGSFDAYFLIGLASAPAVLMLIASDVSQETGEGGESGTWGPPGGFDG